VLDAVTLHGDPEAYQAMFSPTNLPSLAHLALDIAHDDVRSNANRGGYVPDKLFGALFPQLQTLSLRNSSVNTPSLSSTIRSLPRRGNLQHLAVSAYDPNFAVLIFRDGAGLILRSLHIHKCYGDIPDLRSRLITASQGDEETIRVEKVVLYGRRFEHIVGLAAMDDEDENFEWRKSQERPPFEDFDGK
jgi:hypothetical protein